MKNILVIVLLALIATPAISQSESGIFLTIKCGRKMPRQTVALTQKQFCLATSPIILTSDFQSVTEVKHEEQKVSFDVMLTANAVARLRRLAANLPETEFALVVEKEVFAVFPAKDISVYSTLRFQGFTKDLSTFNRVQDRLKSVIAAKTQ